jgi:hypothetical protein
MVQFSTKFHLQLPGLKFSSDSEIVVITRHPINNERTCIIFLYEIFNLPPLPALHLLGQLPKRLGLLFRC